MANIEQGNPFLELKQRTNRDVRQLGPIVGQTYGPVESTAAQSVINLSFAVEQTDTAKKQVHLYVDGKLLAEGAGNDYTYIGAVNGQSSQIQLAAPLAAGLNIFAERVGVSIQNFPSPATVQATLNNDVAQPNLMAQAGFQNFIEPKYTDAPFTQIQNRAQVLDLTNSLGAIAGVERIHTKGINLLSNEFGPNGERAYEIDTKDNRIRFIGNWFQGSDAAGTRILSALNTTDFLEITFYGTGLNILLILNSGTHNFVASVDGGAEGGNLATASYSGILVSRNYSANTILNVTSGLSLGLHTVKIRNNTVSKDINLFGFEILNERTDLAVLLGTAYAGTKREILAAQSDSAFNAGISGIRGARVIKYIKDGVISQTVQEVNPAAAYLASADHANEEIVRRINFREFGANRADDFSTLTTTQSNRAFTLDDGATTLIGGGPTGVSVDSATGFIGFRTEGGAGGFWTLTFTGTGLDVFTYVNGGGTLANTTLVVDGVSQGSITNTWSSGEYKLLKLCSGLPYGTHTIKWSTNGAPAVSVGFLDFIIHQPKKPAIPANAIEVADYNVTANYVQSSSGAIGFSGTGVVRKNPTRELTYVGSWTAISGVDPISFESAFNVATTTIGAYVEYIFWGTGIVFNGLAQVALSNATFSIDGSSDLSSFTTSLVQTSTGNTFNPATGVFTGTPVAQNKFRVSISGLPLGKHVLRVTNNTAATALYSDGLDIITPIHINKSSLKVGNLSLSRNENYQPVKTETVPGLDLSRAKAWVVYDQVNSKILSSYNISAVLSLATGQSRVFFEKPFKNDYVVAASVLSSPNTPVSTFDAKLNYINIVCVLNAASNTNSIFSAVFYGKLIDEE